MNPWDSERTYQEPGAGSAPSGSSGLLWLVAIIIAVIGLAVMSRHGANSVVAVPIGISLFFMVMFIVSHRRETRRIAWKREVALMHEAQQRLPQNMAVTGHAPVSNQPADLSMRKIFDRFDLKVITKGREKSWDAKRIAGFLDYARDFVDTQHASSLMKSGEKGELERHLEASLERALLQYDMENPGFSSETPF
ncbi:MAG: hypothetical protein KDB29_13380 [Planctomycetes bacterium]|nr:hypothetical protein [Planctomycetota bacterium]